MPSRSRGSGQPPKPDIKKFRSDVAKLKNAGVLSSRVDARSQRQTAYMKHQVKINRDVLEGRAKAVKVPRAAREEYSDAYRAKNGRVIIPTEPGETVFFDPKKQRVVATRKGYEPGLRLRREFLKTGEIAEPLPDGFVYVIPLGNGEQRFDTWEDAVLFMTPYEAGPHKYHGSLGDWRKYLIVERTEDADADA